MREKKFHQLFEHQLRKVLWAQKRLKMSLMDFQKAPYSGNIQSALLTYSEELDKHIDSMERIITLLNLNGQEAPCETMEELLTEVRENINEYFDTLYVKDAAIIMAVQKIIHYKIATCRSLLNMAAAMSHEAVSQLLKETLEEEIAADNLLSSIAIKVINQEALMET